MKKSGANGQWWVQNGKPMPEVKIGMVMDDYKVNAKEAWWAKAMKQLPSEFHNLYAFDREEVGPGVTSDTTSVCRWFKLKSERT